ncbi:MAG: ketoacyl-ACP synthase III [Paludibacter sp.]|nr:ketoacyl-ACP synthase III [Paludibacter sp.]
METFIKAISYYLPETVLTNEQLIAEFPEENVGKVAKRVGINIRHIAGENECASDLAVKAAEQLFAEHSIHKSEIDFLLLCTQTPDYFMPATACIVQDRLNLPTSCGALDVNLGCSGYVYGLSLAKGLIVSEIAKNVLLITADATTKQIHPRDKGNRTLFGDAATATLISTDGFAKIESFSLGTDGSGYDKLIVKRGAFRNRKRVEDDLAFDDSGNAVFPNHLYMDGPEIFNFTLENVPKLVSKTLVVNGLMKEEIDLYIFHQANKFTLDFLKNILEIDDKKFYYCISEIGNTASSTIPIALIAAMKENVLSGNVLIAGFGVGLSWAGCILKIKKS